jgi:hypothetical protein
VYRELEKRYACGLAHWLSDGGHQIGGDESAGPIQFVPAKKLFAWVDQDMEERGYWLARILPKTLDTTPAGRLTRAFIAKYGAQRSVSKALWARFHSRGWWGPASEHFRRLRDDARLWLADENDRTVIRWIEDYIDGLSNDIDRAQIEEERRL